MQEGILSLMQMAKTVASLGRYRDSRKTYISVCPSNHGRRRRQHGAARRREQAERTR